MNSLSYLRDSDYLIQCGSMCITKWTCLKSDNKVSKINENVHT